MRTTTTTKVVPLLQPLFATADTDYNATIDTKGFDFCTITFLGSATLMHSSLSICSVTECDTSGGTYTAIDKLTLGNAAAIDLDGSAVPLTDTDDGDTIVFQVDCSENRKRFLKLNTKSAAGGNSIYAAVGVLSRVTDMGPDSNTNACTAVTGTAKVLRA